MADPEQMYTEVLEEERKKGVSPAVAEGRAKAARVRAELGSPHPKEAKWWPGAQPHLEGGEAEPPAAAAEAAEEPAEEEAAQPPPAPATEEPEDEAAQPPPAEDEAAQPPPAEDEAAQPPPAPAEPAAEPAQPPAAPTAEPARPAGVTHGTATGTRLRPEDAVGTQAAFEGQQAMYQRRKLIDELLETGVPEVTAAETGPRGGLFLALLYIAIPLVAIFILAAQDNGSGEEPSGTQGGGAPAVDVTLVAEAVAWDTDAITLPGGATVAIDNRDSVEHNFAIYENEQDADDQSNALVETPNVAGGESAEFPVDIDQAGDYVFQCDLHPAMRGTATVE